METKEHPILKNERANQEVIEEIEKYMEANENDNTTTQNLWDAAKAVISGKKSNPGLPKEGTELSYTTQLYALKSWRKEQQVKAKTSRRREIINIRAEINAIKTKNNNNNNNNNKSRTDK